MPEIPTHDYQCPCDMCEPEAHSVAEYPIHLASGRLTGSEPNVQDLNRSLEMALERGPRKQSRPTLPASSKADLEVAAFESLVKQVGEGKARWSKLLELLEESK